MTTINWIGLVLILFGALLSIMLNFVYVEKDKGWVEEYSKNQLMIEELKLKLNDAKSGITILDKENALLIKDLNYCNRDLLFAKNYSDIKVNGGDLNLAYGDRIMGLNKPNHYIFLITNETSYEKVCLNFLHELGHERCWDNFKDQNEACAEKFALDNSWRCDALN